MTRIYSTLTFLFISILGHAQLTPEITSWIINTTGETGYSGIETNVQQVQYSDNNVYISCTCIPGYDIGPWPTNPNVPTNQNFVYKITRFPVENTGTLIKTPLGHIGVWSNGVSIFNAMDAFSYNNLGIWNQNAVVVEGISFDECLGHPAPNGEYHHHLNPTCLYDDQDSTVHSPIIGYAFDGFPVYGAFGYKNADGTGGITKMRTSFHERPITERTSLPDGTALSVAQYGPAVSGTYPLGYYLEDFEYIPGSGDLDAHNGRFCITPDYPDGIYAYFVTLDADGNAAFPYTIGTEYYGTVQAGNTGPGSGHNTITESVETYTSIGALDGNEIDMMIYPNPAADYVNVFIEPAYQNNLNATLTDVTGKVIDTQVNMQPGITYTFDVRGLANGIYFIRLENEEAIGVKQITINNYGQ